jgi:hypothetical protein
MKMLPWKNSCPAACVFFYFFFALVFFSTFFCACVFFHLFFLRLFFLRAAFFACIFLCTVHQQQMYFTKSARRHLKHHHPNCCPGVPLHGPRMQVPEGEVEFLGWHTTLDKGGRYWIQRPWTLVYKKGRCWHFGPTDRHKRFISRFRRPRARCFV